MDYASQAREHMVECQLLTQKVLDRRILEAIYKVPREWFVPEALQKSAYVDDEIEIAPNRYLMEPAVFARLLELAEISPGDKVMDVGCATGYSTAVIAQLASDVVAIDEHRELADKTRQHLKKLKLDNAEVYTSALVSGYALGAPYNVIIIEGAVEQIPQNLLQQLAEGGRMVGVKLRSKRPAGTAGWGHAFLIRKIDGKIHEKIALEVTAPVLQGFELKRRFQF